MSLCEDEELVRGKSEVAGEGLTQANTQRSEPTAVKTLVVCVCRCVVLLLVICVILFLCSLTLPIRDVKLFHILGLVRGGGQTGETGLPVSVTMFNCTFNP